jgi:hypothetical protein
MKLWKSTIAMLLCSGLVAALGLTACGDDDDDGGGGMSCAEALSTITSDTCQQAVEGAWPAVQFCLGTCNPPDDPVCVGDCLDSNLLPAMPSSCVEAVNVLLDEEDAVCGACFVGCGQEFVDCAIDQDPATTCLNDLSDCVLNQCALP